VPESQHLPGQEVSEGRRYRIAFGQIYLSKPMMTESDGESATLFPHEARLRNLTCACRPQATASLSFDAPLSRGTATRRLCMWTW